MSFFSSLLNKIRGINQNTKARTTNTYMFGVILSGTYSNWKRDPHPTFLCLGCYAKANGQMYVHGIQLHSIGNGLNYLLTLIQNMKRNGVITNPLSFFNYLKMNNPTLIKEGYRTYNTNFCNFKIVNAGLTNIPNVYPPDDARDGFLKHLEPKPTFVNNNININTLKENITRVINTVKIW